MQTKVIQSKMKSIKNIRKITKTMEMVSVSKMKRAVNQVTLGTGYVEQAEKIISTISSEHILKHPLVQPRKEGRELLILIASDKGLCGGYNTLLYRALFQHCGDHTQNFDCITIGKYADRIARRVGVPVIASFGVLTENIDDSVIYSITKLIIEKFTINTEYKSIKTISQKILQGITFSPGVKAFLPITSYSGKQAGVETDTYLFEPNPTEILDIVLPEILQAILLQRIQEARAAEHTARMVAMKNATDNATNYYDALSLSYNRARQAGITQEIAEIVGGASALTG